MSEGKSDPAFNGYKTRYMSHKDGSWVIVFYDGEFDIWRAIKHTAHGDVDTWKDFDGNTPESKAKAEKWATDQGYYFTESFTLLKNVTSLSEGKMKDAMTDMIELAAKLVDEPENSSHYSMYVVAKVLELDTKNLFKHDIATVEDMVKETLGLSEGTVTTIKKMRDLSSGKDVMVNMDKAQPMSLLSAFGGNALQTLHDLGLKTLEKPSFWEELDSGGDGGYRPWKEIDVRRAEKALDKKFPRIDASEIFGSNEKTRGPLKSYTKKPVHDHCIVKFSDGTSYFIDTTQANTYARMWAKVE